MLKTTSLVCVVLFAAACGKKAEEKKPEPAEKIVEKQPGKEPAAALTRMTLTTKSAEAKAAFEKGQELAMNQRGEEARAEFKKAVELDPEFAVATARLGMMTPGAEGTDMIAKAGPLAAKATDAEKAWVDVAQAMRAGDPVKAQASLEKVAELAPGQWEVYTTLGEMANGRGDVDGAIKHYEKALSIKPDLAQVQNGIAYAYAQKKDWDKAIGAAKKQVELLPKEPNPVDSLAEIELMANKLDDSEKDFVKATEIEPKFSIAWQGAGLARAYKGDFKGAYEAFDKRAAVATAPGEKFEVALDKAWLQFSENKLADATATLDAAEKDAELKKFPLYTFYAADRAWMLMQSGKYADAAKWNATMLTRINDLAGDAKSNAMTRYRVQTLRLAALQGKPAPDADKLIADAVEEGKRLGDNKFEAGVQGYMRGLAAWAKGGAKDGPKAAIAEMSKCDEAQLICRYDLAAVTRKSGDAAGADAIERAITDRPNRSPEGVYVKTHPTK
jgi:tetratricopeptide (TPR) repeat protein